MDSSAINGVRSLGPLKTGAETLVFICNFIHLLINFDSYVLNNNTAIISCQSFFLSTHGDRRDRHPSHIVIGRGLD